MNGLTVLIADDETPITSILCSRLTRAGFEVQVAHDGHEALCLAKQHRPHVVVTDLQMPRCTGLEFATAMKEDPQLCETPVLLLTARGYFVDEQQRSLTNIRAVMAKPFSANEVVRAVLEMVGSLHEAEGRESA